MLSSAKMRRSSWRYYERSVARDACEYFTGAGESPSAWYGRGLAELGLAPEREVSVRALEAVFARGLHPQSGEALGRAWRIDAVTGYDLTFSAPKSVSALWTLGGPQVGREVAAAHAAAVRAALDYLDRQAAFSRVGDGGSRQVRTSGFAAAVFDHRTSREGDPQLHSHALVVNKLRCADGEWRTIDGHELYAHKKAAGAVYQVALRAELTDRLQVAFTPANEHAQAEVAGVPAGLLRRWSKRTGQVIAEAGPAAARLEQSLGRPLSAAERAAVTKTAVLKTRPAKTSVSAPELHARWRAEAADAGVSGASLLTAVRAAARTHNSRPVEPTTIAGQGLAAAGQAKAVFSAADLTVALAAALPPEPEPAGLAVRRLQALTRLALAEPQTVRLRDAEAEGTRRASDALWATRATLAAEARILGYARSTGRVALGVVDPATAHRVASAAGLDDGQRVAVVALTGDGTALAVLIAPAGAGKTTTVAAAAAAWRAAGYAVAGLAPTARAAAELTAAGLPADTVARWLLADPQTFAAPFGRVLVVDEASMLSTADLEAILTRAQASASKVVLVGDPAQLGPIRRAGGLLATLARQPGAVELTTVHRFVEPWERAASLALRRGEEVALRVYRGAGRIHPAADADAALDGVLARWQAETAAGRAVLMMARARVDVDALNYRARAVALAAGTVRGPVLARADGRAWQAGDLLQATRNDRRIAVGAGDHVRNGQRYTVLGPGAEDGGLLVQRLDTGGRALLPAGYVAAHTRYGWASTIDAAQGATVDVGVTLARPGLDREHLYVAMTRGRHANHVHVAPTCPDDDHHQPTPAQTAADALGTLRAALARPGAPTAATDRLPGRDSVRPAAAAEPPPFITIRPARNDWTTDPAECYRTRDAGRSLGR